MLQETLFVFFLAFNYAICFSITSYGIRSNQRRIVSMSQVRPPLRFGSRFNHIVQVSSASSVRCGLTADTGITLTTYMQLPSSQYVCIPLPARATLDKAPGSSDEFLLKMPQIQFFDLKVLPKVYCNVKTEEDQVTISSTKCTLGGSYAAERLNECYKFNVVTKFRWIDTPYDRRILSTSDILVYVDPPLPFSLLPQRVLETTGNYVMKQALDYIEQSFITSLANDYHRWAVDPIYRLKRGETK